MSIYKDGYHSGLDFLNVSFHGRAEELQLLHRIYKVCEDGEQQAPFPMVAGFSGTGKTTLVERFMNDLHEASQSDNDPCYCLSGKYGDTKCEDPFSAIVEAFSAFLLRLQLDIKELELFRKTVLEEIGAEVLKVLSFVIPDLKSITEIYADQESQPTYLLSAENTRNRLKYAFQTLLKVLCSEQRPVVMFLDDLQWADSASLDLINSLLKDKSLRHFMLIGAIRSNEVDRSHPVSMLLEELSVCRTVERIDLLDLSIDEMGEFICKLLGLYADEAVSLTEVVYSKTKGNIFFAVQMLKELEQRKILQWSMRSFRWQWNLDDISPGADFLDNVIDVVANRMKNASEKLQKVLTIASYVRSYVDLATLQLVLKATRNQFEPSELVDLLDEAVLKGLLSNALGSTSYKFEHDQVQQAARSLVEPGRERDNLRGEIGQCLFELWSSGNGADWMLFVAADHINSISSGILDPLRSIHLNLKAGEKAFSLASFTQASNYLNISLGKLRVHGDQWTKHYGLSIRLYRATVDVELVLGHFDLGCELAKQLLDNTKNHEDKFPTLMSLAKALGRQERTKEALDTSWTALRMLGEKKCHFKPPNLMKGLLSLKVFFRIYSDDKILNTKLMTDKGKLSALSFYDEVALRAYFCGDFPQWLGTTVRRLRMSFKYGLCASTALAIVNYAVYVGKAGNHQMAMRLARLARKIIIITKAKHMEAKVLNIATRFIEEWCSPYPGVLKTYEQGHKAGMEIGDTEFGFYNLAFGVRFLYTTGHCLGIVDEASEEALTQCRIYNVDTCTSKLVQMRLCIHHLTGRAGATVNWDKLNEFDVVEYNNAQELPTLFLACLSRLELAVYFGEYRFAHTWIKRLKECSSNVPAADVTINRLFFSGLALTGLARQTGLQEYVHLARKEANELKQKIKTRQARSFSHRYLIMEAELMALERRRKMTTSEIKELFLEAIDAATQVGHIHDAALGTELAGEFFLNRGDNGLAKKHFTVARDLYQKWGAFAKVEHLQAKRGRYIDNVAMSHSSIGKPKMYLDLVAHTASSIMLPKNALRIPKKVEVLGEEVSHLSETESCFSADGHFEKKMYELQLFRH